MRTYKYSYVADAPSAAEFTADDSAAAICAALERLNGVDYRDLELRDDHGVVYLRQAPSRILRPTPHAA